MRRHLIAMLVMCGGSAMVFGLIVLMNAFSQAPEKEVEERVAAFEVAPPPPPKKKKRSRPKRERPAVTPTSAAPPPSPNLAASLSTVSLGLPGVGEQSLGDLSDQLLGDVKSSVMTEDSVDSKPKPMRRSAAAYPPRARAEGVTGYVTLNLLIDESGRVERIKVLDSKPAGVFEEAAKNALREWQFEPATYQGEPVKVWARQTVRFNLS